MCVLPLTSVGQYDRGVGLEDRRDGRGDGPVYGRAIGDPGDIGVGPDTPPAAVPEPRDHAVSLDT